MVTDSIIKHLLCDTRSLRDYLDGREVSFEDIKRRMLLLERSGDVSVPDHYYRLNQRQSFNGINSIGQILTEGLYSIAKEYLELREGRIYVKQARFNQWQELITYIPPLILQCVYMSKKLFKDEVNIKSCVDYYNKYLHPNFRNTALPSPYVPQLLQYIDDNKGLHDLHMHLNGSTETDAVWQDMLFRPEKAHKSLDNNEIKEQLEQENVTPSDYFKRLIKARSIREELSQLLFACKKEDSEQSSHKDADEASPYHPMSFLFENNSQLPECWMPLEALLYTVILEKLKRGVGEHWASQFHYYLLLLGETNRLLVQQVHQFGFQQFQKITKNDLRRSSEDDYYFRFRQLHGNDNKYIGYLEGRFAPRSTKRENEILIDHIRKGWDRMFDECGNKSIQKPILKLIAHFIKHTDDKQDSFIRHSSQRSKLWKDGQALGCMVKNKHSLMDDFVGVDAASSEFDAPPEIFAPVYRHMRRCNVKHFTFHAGEDFFHILSGLRAVYESVEFLELGCGDRIGHGTAMGLSPEVWQARVGDEIFISQGEYLDNLIFAYHLIQESKCSQLYGKLHLLESRIQELNFDIYRKSYQTRVVIESWLLRRLCPIMLMCDSEGDAKNCETFDREEWNKAERAIPSRLRAGDERICLLKRYHYFDKAIIDELGNICNYRGRYEEVIKVEIFEVFNADELVLLQKLMLKMLHDKEVVIETLPTSNVRIGFHKDFDTYHLWNWIKWAKEGEVIPPVVLGTDDAGIFATNIYNEYANIYCHMVHSQKLTHIEATKIIEQFDRSSKVYQFAK